MEVSDIAERLAEELRDTFRDRYDGTNENACWEAVGDRAAKEVALLVVTLNAVREALGGGETTIPEMMLLLNIALAGYDPVPPPVEPET